MSTQPVWVTEAGNLGVVAENQFNEWDLSATLPSINISTISSIVGNGQPQTATVTFTSQSVAPFITGDRVVVSGVTPAAYNGTYTVLTGTKTQVTFNFTNTSANVSYVSGGSIITEDTTILYQTIAGSLPTGIFLSKNTLTNTWSLAGIPTTEVAVGADVVIAGANVTSKFVVRAYTTRTVGGVTVVNRLADRSFTITVAGQSVPLWITPAGEIGQFYDGSLLNPPIQLEYIDENIIPGVPPVTLVSGALPPGTTLSDTGLISGYIQPNPTVSNLAGFSRDGQGYSQYPFDFNTQSQSYNYEFTLKVTDGRTSSLRTFTMFVYSTSVFNASTTDITSDDTYLDASISSADAPIILNPQGNIGTYRNDNFFAYQFTGYDLNNNALGFVGEDLPPGLTLNAETGWLYGYIPNLGLTELTYDFSVRTYLLSDPTVISNPYYYTTTFIGAISANVTWLTPSYLGSISNGDTSMFYVEAYTPSGLALQYRLVSGSNSKLPQGLTLLPTGQIVGRVSFDMFSLDNGTTTIDSNTTTFDSTYVFDVNVYSANGYISVTQTFSIKVLNTFPIPYNNLYIQCMPPMADRDLIGSLLENVNIFPTDLLFRPEDPNFGVAKKVIYNHAYGLTSATLDDYVTALLLNHYWKDLTLGQIKTARALDDAGNTIYEVVYSEVIDNLVNNDGESVGKEVVLPYAIDAGTYNEIDVVYPNALVDMRTQVIDTIGQESNMLPRWMLSKQSDGRVLGFTPAWVIAYTKPGKANQIAYNIQQQFGVQLNKVDFQADRYELDCALTVNWDPVAQQWMPHPPNMTTFDDLYHYNFTLANGGTNYQVNDRLVIPGNLLGGVSPANDLTFVVNTVLPNGGITNTTAVFGSGTANLFAAGTSYDNVFAQAAIGSDVVGSGAEFDVVVVGGTQTVFDHDSLQFVAPSDVDTNTQAYDRYILYPKRNIIDNNPQTVGWSSNPGSLDTWVNDNLPQPDFPEGLPATFGNF